MDKKFLITGVACTIVAFALSFVAHGVLLHADYSQLPNLLRTQQDAQSYFLYMTIAHVFMGFAFAWIYRQGISPGVPWYMQGVRFGIAIACLMTIPMYLIYYSIQPWPGSVVAKQIVFDSITFIANGLVAAFINKDVS